MDAADAGFDPYPISLTPSIVDELGLTPGEFNHKYRHSPVRRPKRRGYLRNVAVASGNTLCPEALPALRRILMIEMEPVLRAHAAWALGQFKDHHARQALEEAAGTESDRLVRSEIQASLDMQPDAD